MKKSDLKNGMLLYIKIRQSGEGEWFVKIDNNLYSLSDMACLCLNHYNEDLITSTEFTILKIAETPYIGDIFRAYKKNSFDGLSMKILYDVTNDERRKEIEAQMKKLQEELSKLNTSKTQGNPSTIFKFTF